MKIKAACGALVLVAIEGLLMPCNAQSKEGEALDHPRFSFSLGGGYHFSPWNDLNDALDTFGDYLRYVPYYGNPTGTYETIHGDVSVGGALNYRIYESTDLFIAGAYTQTGSESDITYLTTSSGQSSANRVRQELGFSIIGVDIGLRYCLELSRIFSLSIHGAGGVAFGRMTFYHDFEGNTWEVYDAILRQTISEGKVGVTTGIRLFEQAVLTLSTEYRYLTFKNLKGQATNLVRYRDGFEQKKCYEARLLSTKGYFGITSADGPPIGRPWSGVREYGNPRYAFVDLRSFGLAIGIEVEL